MNTLKFPCVKFSHGGKNRRRFLNVENLCHLDKNDDWWDLWFSTSAFTYQLCGKYVHPNRILEDLVIYVYYRDMPLDDENRIEIIKDITITYENYGI